MIEWKDATSYGQGKRGNIQTTSWETHVGTIRVWVSCGHIGYPETWVVTCRELDITAKPIANTSDLTREQAWTEALETLANIAYHRAKKFEHFARAAVGRE